MVKLLRCRRGAAAVEFALVVPLLLAFLFGIFSFGFVFHQYITLTGATREAVRELSVSRGSNTAFSSTSARLISAAPTLTSSSIAMSVAINGLTCDSDAGCKAILDSARGQPATITAQYPCKLVLPGFSLPACTLSTSISARVE